MPRRAWFVLLLALGACRVAAPQVPPSPGHGGTGSAWAMRYGGPGSDEIEALARLPNGDWLLAGTTDSFADPNGDGWLLRLSADGQVVWSKTYGGPADEYLLDLTPTADGGAVVVGWTSSFGAGGADFWVLRVDATGAVRWQRTYGGPADEQAWSIASARGGGWWVAGGTRSFGAGASDLWVLRLNPDGSVRYQATYGGPDHDAGGGDYDEQVARLLPHPDRGVWVVTETASFGAGETDIWLLHLDEDGRVRGQFTYGGPDEDTVWALASGPGDAALLAGVTVSYSPDASGDLWVLAVEPDGSVRWQFAYGLPGVWDEALSLSLATAHTAVVGGFVATEDDWDLLLLGLDPAGGLRWAQRIQRGWDWPNALAWDDAGRLTVAGVTWQPDRAAEDAWVLHGPVTASGLEGACASTPVTPQVRATTARPRPSAAREHPTAVQPGPSRAVVCAATAPRLVAAPACAP